MTTVMHCVVNIVSHSCQPWGSQTSQETQESGQFSVRNYSQLGICTAKYKHIHNAEKKKNFKDSAQGLEGEQMRS